MTDGKKEEFSTFGAMAGGFGGALGGVKLGAALGTAVCPGLGTLVGGLVGGLFGGARGAQAGSESPMTGALTLVTGAVLPLAPGVTDSLVNIGTESYTPNPSADVYSMNR